MSSLSNFDALTEKQKEVAEMIVYDAVESKRNTKYKPRKQQELAEAVGVTARTLRNWNQNSLFLEYMAHLSRLRLQSAMPDFVGVLIQNLERGQNVSTKQLDLIAKVADWLPEKHGSNNTIDIKIGHLDLEDRVQMLQERRRKEVFDSPQKQLEEELIEVDDGESSP